VTRNSADVAIVGGGIIGCALARELAGRGARVTILEREEPGAEASGAAAGMLAPQAEGLPPGPLFDLALESRSLYPAWTAALAEEAGIDAGYRRSGILRCAFPEGPAGVEPPRWQSARGLAVEEKDAGEIAGLTRGAASNRIRSGVFFPDDGVVDNAKLTRALWKSCELRGVTFALGQTALRFALSGGRCVGVQTDGGLIEAPQVVNAAGAWASFDAAFPIPVEPVRGQIVEIEAPEPTLPSVVWSNEVYVVPRANSWLLGSTMERVGFEKQVTAGAVERLIAAAARLLPGVEKSAFRRAWAGLRPGTPDEMPLLGATSLPGLFLATGHFRNGILLAPVTALALADDLSGGRARDLRPFSPARFSKN
jgi:glycine oxidase